MEDIGQERHMQMSFNSDQANMVSAVAASASLSSRHTESRPQATEDMGISQNQPTLSLDIAVISDEELFNSFDMDMGIEIPPSDLFSDQCTTLNDDELDHGDHIAAAEEGIGASETHHMKEAYTIFSTPTLLRLERSSSDLFSFYLSRTANSMGNGSTELNPFIVKLLPLAFSNPLVLQLLLAQSAVHRHVLEGLSAGSDVADRCYGESVARFNKVKGQQEAGKAGDCLVLTISSLTLALTEVARGDTNGFIFDHLIGSKSLLSLVLVQSQQAAPRHLVEFLVEYYIHMVSLSMLALDPRYPHHALLNSSTVRFANQMVARRYIGQLCGCWLEILLMIPTIFQLGQRMRTNDAAIARPSPNDIIMFGFLQAKLMGFTLDPSSHQDVATAGRIFQQAALIYLWTMMDDHEQQDDGSSMHKRLVAKAVSTGMGLLEQLPVTSRVNTSLCWPLVVIGSCILDSPHQRTLRTRLQSMFTSIGLGNMRETLALLERIWKRSDVGQTGPWSLCGSMQEKGIWISFA